MNTNMNQSAFDALLNDAVTVPLTLGDGSTVPLQCRRIPFTTLANLLVELSTGARSDVMASRQQFMDHLASLVKGKSSEDSLIDQDEVESRDSNVDQIAELFQFAMPIMINTVVRVPALAKRFLKDVIIDATDEFVDRITIDHAVVIVEEVFTKLDVNTTAERLRKIFFHAAAVVGKAKNSGTMEISSSPQE